MRSSAVFLALLAGFGLPCAAAEQEHPDWTVSRLLWEGTRSLAADPEGNAASAVNRYTSYLNLPSDETLADLRARVLARRGEAFLALLDFAAAEADFRAANEVWPGSVREEFGRTPSEPPRYPPGSEPEEEEEEEEEPSTPSEPWGNYYDVEGEDVEIEVPLRLRYWSSFNVQRAAPSQLGYKNDFAAVEDLGFSSAAPSGGLNLRLHLGDAIYWILEADFIYMTAEKEIPESISYDGALFTSPDTVKAELRAVPGLLGFQFFLDKNKPYFAFNLGMRFFHETLTLEGSSHRAHTSRVLHYFPYIGITGAFDISKDSIYSVLDLNGFYYTYEDSYAGNSITFTFFQAGWEWGFRLAERLAVFLGARLEYDDIDVRRGSGRNQRFAPVSLGGSLKFELRVF